jgi:hypothetical protein
VCAWNVRGRRQWSIYLRRLRLPVGAECRAPPTCLGYLPLPLYITDRSEVVQYLAYDVTRKVSCVIRRCSRVTYHWKPTMQFLHIRSSVASSAWQGRNTLPISIFAFLIIWDGRDRFPRVGRMDFLFCFLRSSTNWYLVRITSIFIYLKPCYGIFHHGSSLVVAWTDALVSRTSFHLSANLFSYSSNVDRSGNLPMWIREIFSFFETDPSQKAWKWPNLILACPIYDKFCFFFFFWQRGWLSLGD